MFENSAFVRDMHQIAVHRIRFFSGRCDVDVVFRAVCNEIGAALEIPVPPRCDDLDIGLQRIVSQFETHLVVAFARRSMRDRVGAFELRDLDLSLRDHRPRQGRAEKIDPFVQRICLDRRPDEILDEFLAQVLGVKLRGPGFERLFFQTVEFLALSDVGRVADDLAIIGFLQPEKHRRGVESAGIGEDYLVDFVLHKFF